MERRHDHSMGSMDNMFSTVNKQLARDYWYIVVAVVGFLALIRGINFLQNIIRLRRSKQVSVQFPTRPSNQLMQTWATLTAIAREMNYPQLYVPTRYLTWTTPPPLGRIFVLFVYWAIIVYMMVHDAVIHDANFWERIGFRNAWVTVTQLPLIYLLASKTNLIGLIIGMGHERLNWLHRWVARTMFITATVHGFHFLAEWMYYDIVQIELDTLSTMVPYGFGAWAILLWMTITSFKPFRSMAYEFFVVQHVIVAVLLLYVVYIHVPDYARYNVWLSIAAICFDRICRLALLIWQNVKLERKQTCCKGGQRLGHQTQLTAVGTSTTVVTITGVHFEWSVGQHLYLWIPRIGLLETHPYTIASSHSLPGTCICNSIQLVVRSHNGFSKRLHEFARKADEQGKRQMVTAFVVGPYGQPPRWDVFETLILISASTGASYTLPILESILESKVTKCTKRVDFLLTTRKGEEAGFYHDRLQEAIDKAQSVGIDLKVHVAVTGDGQLAMLGSGNPSASTVSSSNTEKKAIIEYGESSSGDPTSLGALTPRKRLSQSSLNSHISHSTTRVDIANFIREAVEATGGETGVTVCGGQSLVAKVRTSVAKLSDERAVHKGTGAQGIYLHVEEYCF